MELGVTLDNSTKVWSAPSTVEVTYTQTLAADGTFYSAEIATPAHTTAPFAPVTFGRQLPNTTRLGRVQPYGPYSGTVTHTGWAADPIGLGWDYQSFGLWSGWDTDPNRSFTLASSVGWATPGNAIPTSGVARFEGKLIGVMLSPATNASQWDTYADVTLTASFADRRVDFSSTALTVPAAGFLNDTFRLSGTLTYQPGQNRLAGTASLSNSALTGPVTAQFYGPGAQEIGGALALTGTARDPTFLNPERLTAAFGAKR